MSRVTAYIKTWEGRCYFDGIPDQVSNLLMSSGRVPSYKALALAILKNDLQLKELGFNSKHSKWADFFKTKKTNQLSIFD